MERKTDLDNKRSTRGAGFCERFLAEKRHAFALKNLADVEPIGRVADLGCGSYPLFLTKVHAEEKYGVDHGLPDRVVDGIKIFQHNINSPQALPFKDNYFDAVTMLAVLEHIEPALLAHNALEMYRILLAKYHVSYIIKDIAIKNVPGATEIYRDSNFVIYEQR